MTPRSPGPERLSPLEAAAGLVFGEGRPVALSQPSPSPLEKLERVILPALERAPCLVTFSGGRDSSAVLAVAAGLARGPGCHCMSLQASASVRPTRTSSQTTSTG